MSCSSNIKHVRLKTMLNFSCKYLSARGSQESRLHHRHRWRRRAREGNEERERGQTTNYKGATNVVVLDEGIFVLCWSVEGDGTWRKKGKERDNEKRQDNLNSFWFLMRAFSSFSWKKECHRHFGLSAKKEPIEINLKNLKYFLKFYFKNVMFWKVGNT